MPVLETNRLLIRPFVPEDLADAHRLLDVEVPALATVTMDTLAERAEWLQWTVLITGSWRICGNLRMEIERLSLSPRAT